MTIIGQSEENDEAWDEDSETDYSDIGIKKAISDNIVYHNGGDKYCALHVFTDNHDTFFAPMCDETIKNTTTRFNQYRELGSNVRINIEYYENKKACDDDEMIIEDCVVSLGSYPW